MVHLPTPHSLRPPFLQAASSAGSTSRTVDRLCAFQARQLSATAATAVTTPRGHGPARGSLNCCSIFGKKSLQQATGDRRHKISGHALHSPQNSKSGTLPWTLLVEHYWVNMHMHRHRPRLPGSIVYSSAVSRGGRPASSSSSTMPKAKESVLSDTCPLVVRGVLRRHVALGATAVQPRSARSVSNEQRRSVRKGGHCSHLWCRRSPWSTRASCRLR